MKTVEIKRFGLISAFKFFGVIFFVIGLILGLFSGIIVGFVNIPAFSSLPIMSKLSGGIFAGIIFGVIYGIAGGVIYLVLALIYNFFASIIGGLKIEIEE